MQTVIKPIIKKINIIVLLWRFSLFQERFEAIFQAYDADATFQYLKSFRRVRVNFTTPQRAAEARIRCHGLKFGENRLACYFTQHVDGENNVSFSMYNIDIRRYKHESKFRCTPSKTKAEFY